MLFKLATDVTMTLVLSQLAQVAAHASRAFELAQVGGDQLLP